MLLALRPWQDSCKENCTVYVFRATYLKGSNVKIARACDYFYTVLSLNLLIISLLEKKSSLQKTMEENICLKIKFMTYFFTKQAY